MGIEGDIPGEAGDLERGFVAPDLNPERFSERVFFSEEFRGQSLGKDDRIRILQRGLGIARNQRKGENFKKQKSGLYLKREGDEDQKRNGRPHKNKFEKNLSLIIRLFFEFGKNI